MKKNPHVVTLARSLAPISEDAVLGLESFLSGFQRGACYLVGVSGGRDSVALVHLLRTCGFRSLVVCHLDHGLRGREGRRDEKFVRQLAEELGCAYETEKVSVKTLAKRNRQSLETVARDCRYAFFSRVGAAYRTRRIFLGHHADDRVETFLFNLFRGAGPAGLSALGFDAQRRVEGRMLRILRPLIGLWRADIDGWVRAHGVEFREDASNTDRAFSRNRMRHELIPTLEESFGREIRQSIWRTAEILEEENALVAGLVREFPLEPKLRRREIALLHPAMQRRVVHAWLRERGVADIGFSEVERVLTLLDVANGPAKVNLPGGRFARRRSGALFIE